ncbi:MULTISPECIES: CRISPR-associated endonuclease Cas1 [Thermodesulfovibrio]|uniref:CRISPR-associated endonuclease Cas1 n=1 Tax=Thermodesulfovibrio yellowstonii (strain ATCC 51303 / DSM 11347 / YP87) TaxID=289376 RepID=B5YJS3_THEYD|nr:MULTISPECIES: CRISPR-associated endonuclease Cas1 [Thermodesulfovibrio]ACI22190.1 hypothetical protein THEYE_A0645 [Thermodesulfovibrio yellowstonii DSM 11347]
MQEEYLKKRTLYLVEKGNGTTVSRDGPSVLIERNFAAPVRIPADYIDKVIIYGNVEIDAFSITLFSSKFIPILIIGRHEESSIILPNTSELKSYTKYQIMMLDSKKIVESFINWIKERRAQNQKKVLNSLFENISISIEAEDRNYNVMINKIKPSDFLWSRVKEIMQNLIIITILSNLIKFKLDPHIGVINQGYNYGLVFDIYQIYEPYADFLTFQFFYADGANIDFIKNPDLNYDRLRFLIDKFEKKKDDIEQELNSSIAQILSFLRSIST